MLGNVAVIPKDLPEAGDCRSRRRRWHGLERSICARPSVGGNHEEAFGPEHQLPFDRLDQSHACRSAGAIHQLLLLLGTSLGCLVSALLLWAISLPSAAWSAEQDASGEAPVCLYDPVRIEGNRFFETERLLSEIQVRPNSSQDAHLLERDIDRILSLYEENGFPYCQVSPSHFRLSKDGELLFSFLVEEGPRVRVEEIQLEGLKTTKEKVILRELGRGPLGFFSQTRVDAGLRRIERLSYIEEAKEAQLLAGNNPEEGLLKISLVEGKSNSLSGVLGYAPGSADRKGNLFGMMELVFDNIFGTGRMTRWNWFKKDPHSSQLSFLYREPWLLGFPPTLELGFRQADYDSTYMQLSFSARLLFNSTGRISWGIQTGWEKTVPGTAGKTYLPHSRQHSIGAIFSVDLLDRPANPRKGLFYHAEMSYTRKRNHATSSFSPDKERVSSKQISLDLNHFLPTLRKQTLSIGLHLKALDTEERIIPVTDHFRLGGINSIRGYREEEFSGTRIAWANVEYRFLLKGNSRIFFFTDLGYFERNVPAAPSIRSHKISGEKSSYGFGLRIDSKAGLLGIDYGLGEGDSFNQGKIHFGITNRF